jgi:hypothetical protein
LQKSVALIIEGSSNQFTEALYFLYPDHGFVDLWFLHVARRTADLPGKVFQPEITKNRPKETIYDPSRIIKNSETRKKISFAAFC